MWIKTLISDPKPCSLLHERAWNIL
jgi:hypothetical protein